VDFRGRATWTNVVCKKRENGTRPSGWTARRAVGLRIQGSHALAAWQASSAVPRDRIGTKHLDPAIMSAPRQNSKYPGTEDGDNAAKHVLGMRFDDG